MTPIRLEVKAQRSQFPQGRLLLYTESRSFMIEMPMPKYWNRLFDEFRTEKFFAEIEVNLEEETPEPLFIKKLKWEDW